MKKIIIVSILSLLLFIGLSLKVSAQTPQFNVSLNVGSKNTEEVIKLQDFLISNGFLNTEIKGNYLSLTKKAVVSFQKSQGIIQTGYFGPLTRAAANTFAVVQTSIPATVSVKSVSNTRNNLTAALILSNTKLITWQSSGYPTDVGIDINLIRKVSDSPISYSLVRTIAKDTQNDGQENWTPQSNENGDNLYIEVVCSSTHSFKGGCQFSGSPIKVN